MTITETNLAKLPTNSPVGEIHSEMAAILDELKAIGKESTNKGLGFDFRGIEQILNAINPLLGKHGVVPRPVRSDLLHWEPKTKGYAAVVKVTYHFTARDGSWVEAQTLGEGHDFGDKAVSKAMAIAEKICLGQTFAIAYQDEPDPDGDTVVQEDETSSGLSATAAQGESRSEGAAEARTGPPPPPVEETPLEKRNRENFERVRGLHPATLAALKTEMAEKGISMDFSTHTEDQAKWIEDKTCDF